MRAIATAILTGVFAWMNQVAVDKGLLEAAKLFAVLGAISYVQSVLFIIIGK
jgi:hypothetical protein